MLWAIQSNSWKDMIRGRNGHRDAILYMEMILEKGGAEEDMRRCLLTV